MKKTSSVTCPVPKLHKTFENYWTLELCWYSKSGCNLFKILGHALAGIVSKLCVQTYEAYEHKANAISPVHQQLIDLGLLLCTLCRSAALHSMQIEYY